MPLANFAAAFAFAAIAIALLSCAESEPAGGGGTQQAASGWYEEQIEDGFGHLDRLPRNWTALPARRHTALFAGGPAE